MIERALPSGGAYSRTSRKLRQLIQDFQNTEYYLRIQRLARLIDNSLAPDKRRIHREVRTIGLLLKLVLLCGKVKPYLEQRFSILFSHYEALAEDRVPWLVKSLENLQVAFSIHFGEADFSLIQII